jgi:hypothetical protein
MFLHPLIKKSPPAQLFIFSRPGTENKKAPPIKSEEPEYIEAGKAYQVTIASDLSVPFLHEMELAPVLPLPREEVAKASQGHDPLPFLISDIKELMQR